MVVAEVRRRRGLVLAQAHGRVLDLDTPGALELVDAAADAGPGGVEAAERYDTIVSTCRLVDVPDLGRALSGLAALRAEGGDVHLIEPVGRPGAGALIEASAGALLPAARQLHLSRDVVATARAVGLQVVDLYRFTVPTAVWPLRRFVQLRATVVVGSAVPA